MVGGNGRVVGTGEVLRTENVVRIEENKQPQYVKDSFIQKTSFNPQTYAEEFQLLQRYTAGSRIVVTYYLLSTPHSSFQSANAIDASSVRNAVQTSYSEIRNFEIVVQDKGLQSSFVTESRETKVTGVALIYPGMRPNIGDLFITSVGDGTFGVFQVSEIERLSYRQGTNHKISFFLREFATEDGVAIIKQSVTKTLWFDKETYLGDATTLLKEDSYLCLKALRQYRNILIRYYYNTFYDKKMGSIIGPDGVYDPYLVHYLNGKISILESIWRPSQLYANFQNYENTLWSRLTDLANRQLVGIAVNYKIMVCRVTRYNVSITSLANRRLIVVDNPNKPAGVDTGPYVGTDTPPSYYSEQAPSGVSPLRLVSEQIGYVLSNNFYNGDKTNMTPFEFLIYAVLSRRQFADMKEFIDGYLIKYNELSYQEQYYYIPLYLWLIDVALDSISTHNTFMT